MAQEVGDQKPQAEVFGSQPVWLALNKSDIARKLAVSEYFSLQQGDQVLCWNAITDGNAEVQVFLPSDFIWVVTRRADSEFLYKFGCNNRMKYIKILKGASAPIIIRDTVRIETVIVEKPAPEEDTRVKVGGVLIHGGSTMSYTEEQWQSFYFAPNPPRGCGGYNIGCGNSLYYRNFIFEKNPPRKKCRR